LKKKVKVPELTFFTVPNKSSLSAVPRCFKAKNTMVMKGKILSLFALAKRVWQEIVLVEKGEKIAHHKGKVP